VVDQVLPDFQKSNDLKALVTTAHLERGSEMVKLMVEASKYRAEANVSPLEGAEK